MIRKNTAPAAPETEQNKEETPLKIVILGAEARYRRYLPDLPFARAQEPVYLDKDSTEEQILAAAPDAEALFVDAITPVSGALMERMPRLRLIHSEGVAFDRIDLAAARARGIDVCNNKGCNAAAVAEQTVLLMLMLLRHALEGDRMVRQGRQMPVSTLMDGLGLAGKLIWCSILTYIKVFLWSLLFFIPGIIAAYRYRFAVYNLLVDPSLSVSEAIRLSCQQTSGMKGALFVLDLSFIGWSLLSSLTAGILSIWLLPYMVLCDLAYFEEGQRRLGRSPYGDQFGDAGPTWEL